MSAKSILPGRENSFQCEMRSTSTAACVPKIAPDAPMELNPTRLKLPPRMNLSDGAKCRCQCVRTARMSAGTQVAEAGVPEYARDEVHDQEAVRGSTRKVRSSAWVDATARLPYRNVPICRSTKAELVSKTRRFRRMCTTPTCSHIGTKKLRSRTSRQC